MALQFTFTYTDDDGNEIEGKLPGKYEVCARCEGHGTHLTPSIGEHAYTREEFEESFFEEEDRAEYFRHGGRYDVTCEECRGARVMIVIDEEACRSNEEKALLSAFDLAKQLDQEYEADCAAERRAGC